jgi:hypothetical protein
LPGLVEFCLEPVGNTAVVAFNRILGQIIVEPARDAAAIGAYSI